MPKSRAPRPTTRAADAALVHEFLKARETRFTAATAAAYADDLLWFAGYAAGADAMADQPALVHATEDDVTGWFGAHTRDPSDPADPRPWGLRSAHRRRSALTAFYAWAVRRGAAATDPVRFFELGRASRRPPEEVGMADLDQIAAYLEERAQHAGERDYPLLVLDAAVFALMHRLALRVSEAAGLSRHPEWMRRLDGAPAYKVLKKGRKERWVRITGPVRPVLESWLRLRKTVPTPDTRTAAGARAAEVAQYRVFVHPHTGYPLTRQRVYTRLRLAARQAGLADEVLAGLHPHALRHSRARWMLDHGYSLADVQGVLDHESTATTAIYVAPTEARQRALLEEVGRGQSRRAHHHAPSADVPAAPRPRTR